MDEDEPHWGRRAYDRVSWQVYVDRLTKETDRRLENLERHDELTRERQAHTVTLDYYEDRHRALQALHAADVAELQKQLVVLQQFQHDQELANEKAAASRRESLQRRLAIAGIAGGSVSAIVALILRALGFA